MGMPLPLSWSSSSAAAGAQLLLYSTSNTCSIAKAPACLVNNHNYHLFVDFVGLYCESKRRSRRIGQPSSSSPFVGKQSSPCCSLNKSTPAVPVQSPDFRAKVCSGCFGATPTFLVNADQLEIKIAQGAKPGHRAKVSVKLVAEAGICTVASGLAKGNADIVQATSFHHAKYSPNQSQHPKSNPRDKRRNPRHKSQKQVKKAGKGEHHLWKKRDSARSGEKARNLVKTVCELPDEKEAVYGALDKWIAWETEFPLIAVAKALRILRKHNQWLRVIQVAKWMLSKGQGTTMGTYDILLFAFDMDNRIDEAASLWNMILHTHTRSISKRLFSRMISLYDHHNMPNEIIEIFADMEELGVRPDEDTVKKVVHAFKELGQDDKQKLVLRRYMHRWKYIHFKGERVRVRRNISDN